ASELTGKAVHRETAVHLKRSRRVVVAPGKHRVDEAHVVRAASQVGKKAAHPGAALAVLPEIVNAFHDLPGLAEKAQVLALSFESLAVHLFQFRLVVEGVEVANAAAAEDLH